MMTREQLERYPFFSKVGAYSIDLLGQKDMFESLRYTVHLLDDHPSATICVFPQGELQPWSIRPLRYKRGVEWILSESEKQVNVLPFAIRAELLEQQRPEVFFMFGDSYTIKNGEFEGVEWLEEEETKLLETLRSRINSGDQGSIILRGSRSIHEKYISFTKRIAGDA